MRRCYVLINGIEAGILTEQDNPRQYTFEYSESYRQSNGLPVCLAMPLSERTYVSKHLFPFFSNMLSEGENRSLQASLFHIERDDDFGILLATAQHDTVGNVTVKPINNEAS